MSRCYRALLCYRSHIAATVAGSSALLYYNTQQQSQGSSPFNLENTTSFKICTDVFRLFNLMPIRTHAASCKDRPNLSSNEFIADAAEIALPAVVSIDVVQREFIFQEVKGSGSGFIVDKRGYIITNEHVIVGNWNVTVVLGDGRKLPGRVVAVDSLTDLALIKVDTDIDLPEMRMGDDSQLRAGQWVVAIGNSLHFPNTVTAGIVSNTARNITENDMIRCQAPKVGHSKYIQTDAAINPGGSGGPLVNLAGEVIAVNTMGIPGNATGIAFSIPVSQVKRFLNEFSQGQTLSSNDGKSTFSLGLRIISLTPDMASYLHHNGQLDSGVNSGVFVFDTVRNSPANKANLRKGDVIVAIENSEIHSRSDLSKAVQESGGRPVTLTFFRPKHGFIKTKITPVKS